MRLRAAVDANQPEIVAALRRCGCTVALTHQLGGGAGDIIVGRQGVNYWLEIKDGSKVPSKRELTPDEIEFHARWRGHIQVVNSVDEALRAVGVRV